MSLIDNIKKGTRLTAELLYDLVYGLSNGDLDTVNNNMPLWRGYDMEDHVISGLDWTGDSYGSTLNASMSSGRILISGKLVEVTSVTSRAFTASKDTYVDIDTDGILYYTEVSNNAASPALSVGRMRIAIIVTGAGSIASAASINQGQIYKALPSVSSVPLVYTDSLGNMICNRSPRPDFIFYRSVVVSGNTNSGSYTAMTGSITINLPDSNRYLAEVILYNNIYNNTTNQFTYMNIFKNGAAPTTSTNDLANQNEIAHKAALGDSYQPVSFNMTFGVVNGDVIQPYVKVSGGFGGFASAGTMIVRVKNVRQ